MKHKRLVLKQSVKDFIDYTLIAAIFTIGIYVSIQSVTLSSEQQKMTESVAMNQSNK